MGLFASGLANYNPEDGKSPLRAVGATLQTLREFAPKSFKIWLDGHLNQEPAALLEVMNTPAIGPRLRLAPEAKPDDGWLDVITISADQQVGFTTYIAGYVQGQLADLPNITHRRGPRQTKKRRLRCPYAG